MPICVYLPESFTRNTSGSFRSIFIFAIWMFSSTLIEARASILTKTVFRLFLFFFTRQNCFYRLAIVFCLFIQSCLTTRGIRGYVHAVFIISVMRLAESILMQSHNTYISGAGALKNYRRGKMRHRQTQKVFAQVSSTLSLNSEERLTRRTHVQAEICTSRVSLAYEGVTAPDG